MEVRGIHKVAIGIVFIGAALSSMALGVSIGNNMLLHRIEKRINDLI